MNPPKPTKSQELAAQLPTIPAPRDPREEPESDPDMHAVVDMISKSDAPKAVRDKALVLLAHEVKRVSGHDGAQDLTIEALRADLAEQGERLRGLERQTSAQSATLGGEAAKVSAEVKAESAPTEAPEAAPKAGEPEAPPPRTVMGALERLQKATGRDRIMLAAFLAWEVWREFGPFLKALFLAKGSQ